MGTRLKHKKPTRKDKIKRGRQRMSKKLIVELNKMTKQNHNE